MNNAAGSKKSFRWMWFWLAVVGLALLAGVLYFLQWRSTPLLAQYGDLTQAPFNRWVKVPLGGDTRCADGGPYAIYVRRGSSNNLLIHFAGGGACWDAETCARPISLIDLDGYYFVNLLDERRAILDGIFSTQNPANALRDWSVVYIPYCTADFHLGNTTGVFTDAAGQTETIYFNGQKNTQAALAFAAQNFAQPQQILLSGDSAGGFAAAIWAGVVQRQYPQARLTELSDSSSIISERWPEVVDQIWGASLQQTFGVAPAADLLNAAYQSARDQNLPVTFLSINTLHDSTLPKFEAELNGVGEESAYAATWTAHMLASAARAASYPNYAYYITGYGFQQATQTTPHTLTPYAVYFDAQENGILLSDWLNRAVIENQLANIGENYINDR